MTTLRYPLATEKAVGFIDKSNVITYVVDYRATKRQIIEEFERLFGVKVSKIRTTNMPPNFKKAFITLKKEFKASDVAIKLKLV
jgi:large subunit ribosomal protein L23